MIASISGLVKATGTGVLVVDVGGIGLAIHVPNQTATAQSVGDGVELFTTLVVREDALTIYGFESPEQLNLFELLRSVGGVGPKTALAAISKVDSADIARAISEGESRIFEQVPGIGSKTAKLIVITLSGKIDSLPSTSNPAEQQLLSAMQSLGWQEKIARPAVQQVLQTQVAADESDMQSLIRAVLKILGSAK